MPLWNVEADTETAAFFVPGVAVPCPSFAMHTRLSNENRATAFLVNWLVGWFGWWAGGWVGGRACVCVGGEGGGEEGGGERVLFLAASFLAAVRATILDGEWSVGSFVAFAFVAFEL